MSKLGFPTVLGAPGKFKGEPVGRLAIMASAKGALHPCEVPCPICEEPTHVVPASICKGRVVAIEQGIAAVDPLPKNLDVLHCFPCDVTFYGAKA